MLLVLLFAFIASTSGARITYILNGRDVTVPGKYPFIASLQQNGGHICGASLISSRWLICAAHCVQYGHSAYTILLGAHDIRTKKQGHPVRYTISRIISHPGFRYHGSFPNDMALIQLSTDVDLSNEFVDTIGLADENEKFVRSPCVLIGWGRLYPGGKNPNTLQEMSTFVKTDSWCKDFIGHDYHPSHLCTFNHGLGICDGDSGGNHKLVEQKWT